MKIKEMKIKEIKITKSIIHQLANGGVGLVSSKILKDLDKERDEFLKKLGVDIGSLTIEQINIKDNLSLCDHYFFYWEVAENLARIIIQKEEELKDFYKNYYKNYYNYL
jgi:hypothetical protein